MQENYGAHDWDGEGNCPQYWKNKGGEVFHVHAFSIQEAVEKVVQHPNCRCNELYHYEVVDVVATWGNPYDQTSDESLQYDREGEVYDPVNRDLLEKAWDLIKARGIRDGLMFERKARRTSCTLS
jgi:hypothetical protein